PGPNWIPCVSPRLIQIVGVVGKFLRIANGPTGSSVCHPPRSRSRVPRASGTPASPGPVAGRGWGATQVRLLTMDFIVANVFAFAEPKAQVSAIRRSRRGGGFARHCFGGSAEVHGQAPARRGAAAARRSARTESRRKP